jgi:hypothetical protein
MAVVKGGQDADFVSFFTVCFGAAIWLLFDAFGLPPHRIQFVIWHLNRWIEGF